MVVDEFDTGIGREHVEMFTWIPQLGIRMDENTSAEDREYIDDVMVSRGRFWMRLKPLFGNTPH